jgi:uncharacterized membrane protein YoaK (UPF0700 family)
MSRPVRPPTRLRPPRDRGRVPGADGDRREVPFPPLAVVLAVGAGAVDAACFARLGQVFAGVMTGNLTLLGLAAANTSGSLAAHVVVALVSYVAGTALGSLVAASVVVPRWRPVTAVLLIELAALTGFTVGWVLTGSRPAGAAQFGLLALGTLAMGLQAAGVRSSGTKLSTTYLTGTLTTAVADLATGGQSHPHTRWSLAVLVAHVAGAATAGGLLLVVPAAVPAVPVAALLGVVALAVAPTLRVGPAPGAP